MGVSHSQLRMTSSSMPLAAMIWSSALRELTGSEVRQTERKRPAWLQRISMTFSVITSLDSYSIASMSSLWLSSLCKSTLADQSWASSRMSRIVDQIQHQLEESTMVELGNYCALDNLHELTNVVLTRSGKQAGRQLWLHRAA